MGSKEKRGSERKALLIKVNLRYPDVDTFVERYAVNLSPNGVFIQTRKPKPVDTLVRVKMLLPDGTAVIRGEGRVVRVAEFDEADSQAEHGMGIKFTRIDNYSRQVIDRALDQQVSRVPAALRGVSFDEVEAPMDGFGDLLDRLAEIMGESGLSEDDVVATINRAFAAPTAAYVPGIRPSSTPPEPALVPQEEDIAIEEIPGGESGPIHIGPAREPGPWLASTESVKTGPPEQPKQVVSDKTSIVDMEAMVARRAYETDEMNAADAEALAAELPEEEIEEISSDAISMDEEVSEEAALAAVREASGGEGGEENVADVGAFLDELRREVEDSIPEGVGEPAKLDGAVSVPVPEDAVVSEAVDVTDPPPNTETQIDSALDNLVADSDAADFVAVENASDVTPPPAELGELEAEMVGGGAEDAQSEDTKTLSPSGAERKRKKSFFGKMFKKKK